MQRFPRFSCHLIPLRMPSAEQVAKHALLRKLHALTVAEIAKRWPLQMHKESDPKADIRADIAFRHSGPWADFREISQRYLSVKTDFDAIRPASPVRSSLARASIAASTLGGDIGSSVSRVPTARLIAYWRWRPSGGKC
jgi:hypothetical protein